MKILTFLYQKMFYLSVEVHIILVYQPSQEEISTQHPLLDRIGRDRMEVGFKTTYAISAYHKSSG
jgi:hypothetical protein